MELIKNSISTAHPFPDTKKIKNHVIVKFVLRDMREKVYKKRASLMRKSMRDLPSVAKNIGKSIQRANKIYINESLTSYRNRLFGRIHEFKKSNKFKFLCTVNGKISLRESKTSIRFTNLQLMKNLKNFWIYEAKKHSSCYFNSIYLLYFYCY